jgi:hypothetical protein
MKISGNVSEFSLPELLRFLDRQSVTGLLSLEVFSAYYNELKAQTYAIWLKQGNIVAASYGLYKKDIFALAVHKEWLSPFVAQKLAQRLPETVSAGSYLESQGALHFGQLHTLFSEEVIDRVQALFEVKALNFEFETIAELPLREMTGLSIPAATVIVQRLRSDRSLRQLEKKLISSKLPLIKL